MKTEVVIFSKTRMSNAVCIGGLVLENNRYVRLLNKGNQNQEINTDFSIGGVWYIDFINRNPITPPHIEDTIVIDKTFVRNIDDITTFLTERNLIDWNGDINNLFEGKIKWTEKGSGYINDENLPKQSVGFWIADKNLTKREDSYNNIRYDYPSSEGRRSLKFIGFDIPIDVIPAGTILRVSLARWWKPDENTEERCYLQLSGWYLDRDKQKRINDDFPF